ncbi:cysteine desulfurase family protein [Engelhardtia mirabilis]|uniref:Cysteine desulfurase n=1 Tax=Engelhardtia mirabilis TaxID=2528011 RepID=A0A518BT31_9BACT|nr:Cysteine desulfurase [Planctomycetes bacterium Pla133]QDV04453.1 Cysteine desulfurase [Planctomycetes bacterium Pla86]
MTRRVYLDHNATTPLRPEVREFWIELVDRGLGNPSSLHAAGREARQLVDEARERLAACLQVHEDGVIFTSGGTEADNLALFGCVEFDTRGRGLATSTIEHSAVLEPAAELARRGRPWIRLPCDEQGRVEADVVAAAARQQTCLVSVIAASNELGTLQDVAALAQATHEASEGRARFHTDAVQAVGRIPIDLDGWEVDMATMSPHKLGGPVGVGILVVTRGTRLAPRAHGGGQERGLRPGTESVAAIAAGALAVELAIAEQPTYAARVGDLAARLWTDIAQALPGARLLGPPMGDSRRLPNTLNVLLPGVDGRVLVTRLDLAGLEASAGSACASGSVEPSHVLVALGLDDEQARAGLRLSLGRTSTLDDCQQAVEILVKTCRRTHATRPLDDRL